MLTCPCISLYLPEKWIPNFHLKTAPTGRNFDIFMALSFLTFDFIVPICFLIMAIILKDLPLLPHTSLPKYLQNLWIYIPEYMIIFYAVIIYCHTVAFQVTSLTGYFGESKSLVHFNMLIKLTI